MTKKLFFILSIIFTIVFLIGILFSKKEVATSTSTPFAKIKESELEQIIIKTNEKVVELNKKIIG